LPTAAHLSSTPAFEMLGFDLCCGGSEGFRRVVGGFSDRRYAPLCCVLFVFAQPLCCGGGFLPPSPVYILLVRYGVGVSSCLPGCVTVSYLLCGRGVGLRAKPLTPLLAVGAVLGRHHHNQTKGYRLFSCSVSILAYTGCVCVCVSEGLGLEGWRVIQWLLQVALSRRLLLFVVILQGGAPLVSGLRNLHAFNPPMV